MNNPFPYPIKEEMNISKRLPHSMVTVYDGKVILLDWEKIPKDSPDFQRNIACLDESGKVIWQIERLSHYFDDAKKDNRSCYYFGMTTKSIQINGNPTGDLLLYNACDVNLLVNHKTEAVIKKKIMHNPFLYPIFEEITIGEYRIVLLDWQRIPTDSPERNRNVACLNKSGEILWQIEKFSHYPGAYPKGACCYLGITLVNNKLVLSNGCDLRVIVDYKTGEVLEKKEEKS